MLRFNRLFIYLWVFFVPQIVVAQTAGFTGPDTVCVNEPINLTNTSTGVTNYLWNFCSGTVYNSPELVNLGNPGFLTDPVFSAIAKDGNNYYVFVINNTNQNLVRLNFGNSLLNTPVATALPGVQIPPSGEGIQIVQDAAGWHIIVVGGTVAQGSRIVKVDFGASLANNSPTGTNWGNIGSMAYPTDLYIFKEGNRYYGFTTNFETFTITRLDFGTDFSSPPTGFNMGTFGGMLNRPAGIFAVLENGNWHLLVTNEINNKLIRLDFGPSLLNNTPTAVDLGNPGNALNHPRDISVVKECGQTMAVVVNGAPGSQSISRLYFPGGITGTPTGNNLGNPGGTLAFPSSISSVFRVDNVLYAFATNVTNGTMTRVAFKSCTDASIPNATTVVPPTFHYTLPGRYTVNLITDEGTVTQQTFCKTIVVVNPPTVALGMDIIVCNGATVNLDAGAGAGLRYSWSTGADTRQITVTTSGLYDVTVDNGGCTATDQIAVTFNDVMTVTPITTDIDCASPTGTATINVTGGTAPYRYTLDNNGVEVTNNVFTNLAQGNHIISVKDAAGCITTETFAINIDNSRIVRFTTSKTDPTCSNLQDGTISVLVTQGIPPFQYALAGQPFQAQPAFAGLAAGTYKVYVRNGVCLDSQMVTLVVPAPVVVNVATLDEMCGNAGGSARITIRGGTAPYDILWSNGAAANVLATDLSEGDYSVTVSDLNSCAVTANFHITNNQTDRVRIINGDTTINIGDEIILRAENAPDYQWEPIDGGLSCLTCATTSARPVRDTRYIVRTLTGQNCIVSDTVFVRLTYNRSFQMPNAFSPNRDGVNDVFRPKGQGLVVFNMVIYNRWGQMLYQTTDHRKGWDGKMNNLPQEVGTYIYVVDYGFWDDSGKIVLEKKQGSFTLIR